MVTLTNLQANLIEFGFSLVSLEPCPNLLSKSGADWGDILSAYCDQNYLWIKEICPEEAFLPDSIKTDRFPIGIEEIARQE